ncbi:hypothetical protein F5Y13DRAFT_191613 [Hypoxylon sp. FL1857]|nr:hypothetical protein F5Y13DRAFT_191613 [Hypoxylon sp. FL1857]
MATLLACVLPPCTSCGIDTTGSRERSSRLPKSPGISVLPRSEPASQESLTRVSPRVWEAIKLRGGYDAIKYGKRAAGASHKYPETTIVTPMVEGSSMVRNFASSIANFRSSTLYYLLGPSSNSTEGAHIRRNPLADH